MRTYMRHRERLVEYAAAHIQHMQKALMQMNVQLHHVVSDITGATGMKIMRAIVGGQHDPLQLATYRDVRCKASEETIRDALTGHYQREHVFALRQALELYDSYQERIAACDQEVKRTLESLQNDEVSMDDLPAARYRTRQSNEPRFKVRESLFQVLGVDLSQIYGFGAYTALKLVGECGTDMSRWPTVKHFTSWLTLAPGNKISGGKVLSSQTRRSSSRAAKIFSFICGQCGPHEYGHRCFLSAIGGPKRCCQGGDSDSSQAGGLILQCAQVRHGVRRPRCVLLRRTVSPACAQRPEETRQRVRIRADGGKCGWGSFLGKRLNSLPASRIEIRLYRR